MTAQDAIVPATSGHDAPQPPKSQHLGWALALICVAQLMVVLDGTIVNIALPYIGTDLTIDESSLSWLLTGYVLTFGGFLLLGGRAGDLYGRRRAFMGGLILFALASLLGGFAQSEAMILASRALQGLGAAFASPNALALITTTFEPGPKRGKAFAVYGMMSGAGAAVGLLLGGWLTGITPEVFGTTIDGWRLTFLINVPIGLGAAFLAPKLLRESELHKGELDIPGAVTATAGLLSLVYGITRSGQEGWTDPWTMLALGAGMVLLGVFALIESRVTHPLLPFRVLKSRDRLSGFLVMALVPAAMLTMFFFLTLTLQNVMGAEPFEAGLKFLPFSIFIILGALVVSRLVQKIDPGKLAGTGALLASAGLFGLSRLPYDDATGHLSANINYWTDLFPFMVIIPLGMSCVFISMTMSVVHRIAPEDTGIASGVLNTMQQVGGALGLATLSTIGLKAATNSGTEICTALAKVGQVCNPNDPSGVYHTVSSVAFLHGTHIAFLCCSIMMLGAACIAFFGNRIRHQDLATGDAAPAGAH